MFRKETHLPWQQRAGSGTSDAGEGWNIVDVNVGWQDPSITCPQQEQAVFQKLQASKPAQPSVGETHKDWWSLEEAGMMPFAVIMMAGFAS